MFEFSHKRTQYFFDGGQLPLPPPGTYDPAAWTPPAHRIVCVEIQDDGAWRLLDGGEEVANGEGEPASRRAAEKIVRENL